MLLHGYCTGRFPSILLQLLHCNKVQSFGIYWQKTDLLLHPIYVFQAKNGTNGGNGKTGLLRPIQVVKLHSTTV